ncbi:MAG: winged helix-turn-helix domain-containing protein [Oculatellaceae cyanobacterium Prado106]|jgi:DNA-binding transcriptional ArsR family regulator|nr:winged helix-turn-helix domain-containing protein [Oculatellaceae cyanobacterium Prado106]
MNSKTAAKIRDAAPFLLWFRDHMSPPMQQRIRPHLDQPHQLALKVLECCQSAETLTVSEIAQRTGLSPSTARQTLNALREGGMIVSTMGVKRWQVVEAPVEEAVAVAPVS